jgi:hypothetical protein
MLLVVTLGLQGTAGRRDEFGQQFGTVALQPEAAATHATPANPAEAWPEGRNLWNDNT